MSHYFRTHSVRTLIVTAIATLGISGSAMAYGFGAIAVNTRTGRVGISYGQPSKAAAKLRALDNCPGVCRGVLWEHNFCGALVHAPGYFFAGLGATKALAIRHARGHAHDPYARVLAWVCN